MVGQTSVARQSWLDRGCKCTASNCIDWQVNTIVNSSDSTRHECNLTRRQIIKLKRRFLRVQIDREKKVQYLLLRWPTVKATVVRTPGKSVCRVLREKKFFTLYPEIDKVDPAREIVSRWRQSGFWRTVVVTTFYRLWTACCSTTTHVSPIILGVGRG